MSTQSYYKDRLGFDPREALYDGPVKGGARRHHSPSGGGGRNSHERYTSSTPTNNGNDHYATPPNKKHKQQQQQQQQHHVSYQSPPQDQGPQGGYEDALTQFKGSMSLWEYFVDSTDKMGMCQLWLRPRHRRRVFRVHVISMVCL